MFMRIKAFKSNVQKQYSNISSKENRNCNKCMLCACLKTMDLIICYILGATVYSYENVTCKESIFLNLRILIL